MMMAFCKICPCGNTITFETRNSFPEQCPNCNRRIRDFITYQEGDPQIKILLAQFSASEKTPFDDSVTGAGVAADTDKQNSGTSVYVLVAVSGGYEIIVPPEGGIIGRSEIGAKQLADNEAVSRKHLRITPRKNAGVIIQDISTYGTKLNGKPIIPNTPMYAEVNSRITLYNEDFILQEKEVECVD